MIADQRCSDVIFLLTCALQTHGAALALSAVCGSDQTRDPGALARPAAASEPVHPEHQPSRQTGTNRFPPPASCFTTGFPSTCSSMQVGLLLLNKVLESNPEPFQPHYCQLLQLFGSALQDYDNPTALYYCILSLTAITAFIGSEELVRIYPGSSPETHGRK